eukprot:CAMPEP_0195526544 /NCGR_PEP_ID=MMETSP0794_2-20130614/27685_1 /TAXON_ID=515487 /ORGANISM="Stephanopyxis turris, Strain CCMP 815" /LENGTH=295 /DNA_ID=CAMNT_0040657263 /DNA_START=102 /DNA_END=985 /DNA_ORIENTATION=+
MSQAACSALLGIILIGTLLQPLQCVRTGSAQEELRPLSAGSEDSSQSLMDKVLSLRKLSDDVATKQETKDRCLEFADALGIGKLGPSHANQSRAMELLASRGTVFPIRDSEHRISCSYGIDSGNESATTDTNLSAFVDVEDSTWSARGSRWLGGRALRSDPEPMNNTLGVDVLETNIIASPESRPSTADGSAGDAMKNIGASVADAALEQGKWMMDNTAAAKEACVGCLFVWRKIHSAVDQSAGPDTISKMFEQTCAYMPPCFFDACDAMFSQQEAMVQDYLADVSFWDMCIYSG